MKRTPWILTGLLALGSLGCAPAPQPVVIRPEAFAPDPVVLLGPTPPRQGQTLGPKTSSLPGLEAQSIAPRGIELEIAAANALRRRIREEALARVRDELTQRVRREVSLDRKEKLEALEASFELKGNQAIEEIRLIFEAHAAQVGPKRTALAFLVGFPDPDPQSQREPRNQEPEERRRIRDARQLRAEIRALEADYNEKIRGRLDRLFAESKKEIESLDSATQAILEAKLREMEQQAREIVREVENNLQETLLTAPKNLPVVPSEQRTIPGGPTTPAGPPKGTPNGAAKRYTDQQRWQDQVALFLQVNHYRLAKPGEKATDVTEEFLIWRQKFANGASAR